MIVCLDNICVIVVDSGGNIRHDGTAIVIQREHIAACGFDIRIELVIFPGDKHIVDIHLAPVVFSVVGFHPHPVIGVVVIAAHGIVSIAGATDGVAGLAALFGCGDGQCYITNDVVHLNRQRLVGIQLAAGIEFTAVGGVSIIRTVSEQIGQLCNVFADTLLGTDAIKGASVKIHIVFCHAEIAVCIKAKCLIVSLFHLKSAAIDIHAAPVISHSRCCIADEGTTVDDRLAGGVYDGIAVHTVKGLVGGVKGDAAAHLQGTVVEQNGAGIAACIHAHAQSACAANGQAAADINKAVKQIVDIRHTDIDVGIDGQILRCAGRNRDGAAARLKILLLLQRVERLIRIVGKAVDHDSLNGGMLQCVFHFLVGAANHRIVNGACTLGEALMEHGIQMHAFVCTESDTFCFREAFARLTADSPFHKLIAVIRQGSHGYLGVIGHLKGFSDIVIIMRSCFRFHFDSAAAVQFVLGGVIGVCTNDKAFSGACTSGAVTITGAIRNDLKIPAGLRIEVRQGNEGILYMTFHLYRAGGAVIHIHIIILSAGNDIPFREQAVPSQVCRSCQFFVRAVIIDKHGVIGVLGAAAVRAYFDAVLPVIVSLLIHGINQFTVLICFVHVNRFLNEISGVFTNSNSIACCVIIFIPKQHSASQKLQVHRPVFADGNDGSGAAILSGAFTDCAVSITGTVSNDLKIPSTLRRKVRKINGSFGEIAPYRQTAGGRGIADINSIIVGVGHSVPLSGVAVPAQVCGRRQFFIGTVIIEKQGAVSVCRVRAGYVHFYTIRSVVIP